MNIKYRLFCASTIILLFNLIFAVSLTAEEKEKKIIISAIETEIEGSTKRKYLLQEINLFEGKEFDSLISLRDYMDESIRNLMNLRIFENVEYSLVEVESSDSEYVHYKTVLICIDANNTFFLPLAGYGSSNGFKLALKSNFYNINGSLMNFRISSSLHINENEALNNWGIPAWEIRPSLSGIKLLNLDFSLSLSQSFATSKDYNFRGDSLVQQYTYHSTSLSLETSLKLPSNFSYSFGPSLSFNYGIHSIVNLIPEAKIDLDFANLTWTHSFEYKKVDWIDNLRNGFAAILSNSLNASYDVDRTPSFSTSIGAGLSYFWRINKTFNLSGRLNGKWSNKEIGLNDLLRGVRSGYLDGDLGAAMSIDMTISAINIDGLFEIQARPFFDIGIIANINNSFDRVNDLAYTAGLDGILYIDRWKSFVLRGTFGIDLSHFEWNDIKKYEIEMTAGLSY